MFSPKLPLATLSALLVISPFACAAPAPPRPVSNTDVNWQKMPIRSPEMKAHQIEGGEGAQWPRGDLAVSPSDPDFLLLPIDVGGLYASYDGGQSWHLAMNGWNARGANAFAIDPKNADRAIGVAANSMNWDASWGTSPNGLYLSTDKAHSWKQVAARLEGFGGSIAYDASSFDADAKRCNRVYFLATNGDLFRSDDGGETWAGASQNSVTPSINTDWTQGGTFAARVQVNPRNGEVWVSGQNGLLCSHDAGVTFSKVRDNVTYGLDIASDGAIWSSDAEGVHVSRDNGQSFQTVKGDGLDLQGQFAANVHVSPAAPNRLFVWVPGKNFNWKRYISRDAGAHWEEATLDKSPAVLPTNARQGYFAWHPTNPQIAWSIGGDWVSKSTDGGATFRWSNNGYNGVMLGQSFNFSAQQPNTVMLGFQDYNGAFTLDGGQSWNYRDLSGLGWGGHCYGAGQSGPEVMWYGDAEGWGNPRRLKISRDSGQSWNMVKGADGQPLIWHGADISFTDPKNPAILFASNYRSSDKGVTWASMDGCEGVYTAVENLLIGKMGDTIVQSSDDGQSWKKVADVEGGFRDVAFDLKRQRFLVASQDRLKIFQNGAWTTVETPRDQYGNIRVETVALDPANSDIIYAAGARNTYATSASVVRSTDGGASWENLTRGDGAHEAQWIRVHPQTHEAWVAGQCFGMWRLAPPAHLGAGDKQPADAPRAPVLALLRTKAEAARPQFSVNNGAMSDAKDGAPEGWTQMWTGRGTLRASYDKQTFHSAPASFRLEALAADSQGQSGQVVDAPAGSKFVVQGWIKSSGNVKAQVAIQSLRDNWSPIEFKQLKYVQNDSDWQPFEATITLPPETARFNLVLFIEGDGKAWLDDVELKNP